MDSVLPWLSANALALSFALLLDAIFGEPDWLWKRVPHPVVVFGKLISWLDRTTNLDIYPNERRIRTGVQAVVLLVFLTSATVLGFSLLTHAIHPALGFVFSVCVAAVLVAQRSLYDHVDAVRVPLEAGDIATARRALSMIVGRDTSILDESGITRAALESLAENHSDGVIAPAFWFLLGGPVGIAVYKAINTADSMIGYRTRRHLHFGWAAAKLDDAVNWLPARLSICLIALGSLGGRLLRYPATLTMPKFSTILLDAPTHASPNAGWPEAAYASALGVALGGPRTYASVVVDAQFINPAGVRQLDSGHLKAGLLLFHATCAATLAVVVLVALIGF